MKVDVTAQMCLGRLALRSEPRRGSASVAASELIWAVPTVWQWSEPRTAQASDRESEPVKARATERLRAVRWVET